MDIEVLELEHAKNNLEYSREDIFRIASTESSPVEKQSYDKNEFIPPLEIHGDDFSGSVWISSNDINQISQNEGSVDILNEGIFVSNEPSSEWLPSHLSFCDAYFNFSSKSISLPAGRDRVIKDIIFRNKKKLILAKSLSIIDLLVQGSSSTKDDTRNYSSLCLSLIHKKSNPDFKSKIVNRMDNYSIRTYKGRSLLRIREASLRGKDTVYIQYPPGNYVEKLSVCDAKQIFHKSDDLVELQAALLTQEGEFVVSTSRSDSPHDVILEASLIESYFIENGFKVVDLTKVNVIEGKQRSRPVPSLVRQEMGSHIKFVEVTGLPNKKAWKVGNELWINLANYRMRKVYENLKGNQPDSAMIRLAKNLFNILSFNLDDASNNISDWFS